MTASDDQWYSNGVYMPSAFEYDLRRYFCLQQEVMECVDTIRKAIGAKRTDYDCWMTFTPIFIRDGREPHEVSVSLLSDLLDQPKRVTWRGYTLGVALDLAEPEIRKWMREALDELKNREEEAN